MLKNFAVVALLSLPLVAQAQEDCVMLLKIVSGQIVQSQFSGKDFFAGMRPIMREIAKELAKEVEKEVAKEVAEKAEDTSCEMTVSLWGLNLYYEINSDNNYCLSDIKSTVFIETNNTQMCLVDKGSLEISSELDGEYSCIQLRQDNGNSYLVEESRISVDHEPISINLEIEFIEGDWAEYRAGKDVEVRYTEQGLEKYKSSMENQLKKMFEKEAHSNNILSCLSMKKIPNQTILINSKKIHAKSDGPFEFKIEENCKSQTLNQR